MSGIEKRSPQDVVNWLVVEVSRLVELPREKIDIEEPITNYLTDSRDALSLTASFQDWLGVEISAYVVWDHPTIAALADHVAKEVLSADAR